MKMKYSHQEKGYKTHPRTEIHSVHYTSYIDVEECYGVVLFEMPQDSSIIFN